MGRAEAARESGMAQEGNPAGDVEEVERAVDGWSRAVRTRSGVSMTCHFLDIRPRQHLAILAPRPSPFPVVCFGRAPTRSATVSALSLCGGCPRPRSSASSSLTRTVTVHKGVNVILTHVAPSASLGDLSILR